MKERPILFSAAMVRALLDGRKTQTRRVMKLQPDEDGLARLAGQWLWHDTSGREYRCPYGQPGDRLWVRETFGIGGGRTTHYYVYRAGDSDVAAHNDLPNGGWKPSIHMPRSASRITLEITSVRVERVQDISEEDAFSEGADGPHPSSWHPDADEIGPDSYRQGFAELWESINADRGYGWDENPWVWVICFQRIT